MSEPVEFDKYVVKENANYHMAMMQTLILSDQEAAKEGLLEEFEDLIDSWWASIPTEQKLTIRVWYESDGKIEEMVALDAWKEAEKIQPPENLVESRRIKHKNNKIRALKKKQIITDVLYKLEFLFKTPKVSRQDVNAESLPDAEWGDDGEW